MPASSESMPQAFGAWPALLGLGFLATAALVEIGADEALALPRGLVSEGILVGLAVLCFARETRKRRRRITLALGPGELAVYRSGALLGVRPIGAVTAILLNVGASLRDLVCSLSAASIPGVVAASRHGVARAAGFAWSLVFLAGAASVVRTRFRCRHFLVPIGDRVRRIAIRSPAGDVLLAALPRTGNWQVAE